MIIIETEADYRRAEARLELIADAIPGTSEAQELKALTKAIVNYLKKNKINLKNQVVDLSLKRQN